MAADAGPTSVIFDIGGVLFDWSPRYLYEKLIDDERTLEAFLRDVVTPAWHFQHDAGRPFAETSAELTARHPQHAALIAAWGARFGESIGPMLPGMAALIADLDEAGVPLYAITNFSGEFFPPFRARNAALFDRFRAIVVSGDERLMKPDAAIYRLALARFGLAPHMAAFVDDRVENVAAADAIGLHGLVFADAARLRADLVALGFPISRSAAPAT